MPGYIHVSVLGFSELPSSSPSSSILVKASTGKSDYQTWGDGDFSLPLKTLRDNLSITLHDAEGNELSRAGVRMISIAEKGSLDESITLEGGGIVHLRLRFVLSEEERKRIRIMRESATKRKRDEMMTGSTRYSEIASAARGTVAPSSCANREVSDSQASIAQNEVSGIENQAIRSREGHEAYTKEILANKAYESEDASSLFTISRAVVVGDQNPDNTNDDIKTRLEEKNATKLDPINLPKRPGNSEDASSKPKNGLEKGTKHAAVQIEKRDPLQKTSSNDMRPVIKPPPMKTQPDKVGPEVPKDLDSKDNAKPTKLLWSKARTSLGDEKPKPVKTDGMETKERNSTDSYQDGTRLEALQTQVKEPEPITRDEKDLAKMFKRQELNQNSLNVLVPEEGKSLEDSFGKTLGNETNTTDSSKCVLSSTERADEERISRKFSSSESVEKDARKSGIYTDVNRSGKMKSSNENSPEAETSSGPFGQAIKIAIVVAFGSLVLLTRQRKPR